MSNDLLLFSIGEYLGVCRNRVKIEGDIVTVKNLNFGKDVYSLSDLLKDMETVDTMDYTFFENFATVEAINNISDVFGINDNFNFL